MKYLLTFLFLLSTINSRGQITFEKTFDSSSDDYGKSGVQTSDGGFLVASNFNESGMLFKLNSQGDSIWSKQYIWDIGPITFNKMITTQDNGFIILGNKGNSNPFLFKLDNNGDSLWFKSTGLIQTLYDVAEDLDGNIIIVGGIFFDPDDTNDCCAPRMKKLDSNGNNIQTFYPPCPGIGPGCWLQSVYVDSENNYLVSIVYLNFLPPGPGLFKMASDGEMTWISIDYLGFEGSFTSIIEDYFGGYLGVVGRIGSNNDSATIVRYDPVGEVDFIKNYFVGPQDWRGSVGIVKDENGYAIINNCETNAHILRIDEFYQLDWTTSIEGDSITSINDIEYTPDGGYFIVGSSVNTTDNSDIFIGLTDNLGQISSIASYSFDNVTNVFPNPFQTQATITSSVRFENAHFVLFNAVGQIEREILGITGDRFTLQKDDLATGTYFFRIEGANGYLAIGKIFVQ